MHQRKLNINLILALVLTVVGVGAFWLEYRHKPQTEKAEERRNRLIAMDSKLQFERLRIVNSKKSADVELTCIQSCGMGEQAARWKIVKPFEFLADESSTSGFLGSIFAANIFQRIPMDSVSPAKLKEFGLDESARGKNRIELKFRGQSEPYIIYLGDSAAIGDNIYALLSGPDAKNQPLYIINSALKKNSEQDADHWRSRRIFDFFAVDVQALEIKNSFGKFELRRAPDGWLLPSNRRADAESVDNYLTGLVFTQAKNYISNSKISGRTANYVLTLSLANSKQPLTLSVFEASEGKERKLYAKTSDRDVAFEIEHSHADKFAKKIDSFLLRYLFSAAEKQLIETIEVSFSADSAKKNVFKRPGKDWIVDASTTGAEAVGSGHVELLLTHLGATRIEEFMASRPIPATAKELSTWKILKKGGVVVAEFRIFAAENAYYAKPLIGEGLKLNKNAGDKIPKSLQDIVKALSKG